MVKVQAEGIPEIDKSSKVKQLQLYPHTSEKIEGAKGL